MAEHDLGELIWKCIRSESLGKELCDLIQTKGSTPDQWDEFLRFKAKVGLSPKERQYLQNKGNVVCHCIEHCRGQLDVKYDYDCKPGDDDPKRC